MSHSDPQQAVSDTEQDEAEVTALASRQHHLEAVRNELMDIEHAAQVEIKKSEAELEQALDELEQAEGELVQALDALDGGEDNGVGGDVPNNIP